MPELHSILGASGASRWLNCPGSVARYELLEPKEDYSAYADEGTGAHSLGEKCVIEGHDADHFLGTRIMGKMEEWPVNDDMVDAVQVYLDEIEYQKSKFRESESWVEKSIQPFDDREDMFGTADFMLYQPFGELVVIDYKHGRGVVVEVEWNDQMMYYALGAAREIGFDNITKVTMIIVQPRAQHHEGPVRRWTVDVGVLREYADTLRSGAEATTRPGAPLHAGDHCRFCKVKVGCSALSKVVKRAVQDEFDDLPSEIEDPRPHVTLPDPNDPAALGRAMSIIPLLDFFTSAVEGMVLQNLERGVDVPGYKLVQKRSNRAWVDADDIERRLKQKGGVKADDIYTRKLKSPAGIEKIKALGKDKKARLAWVAKHAHKPEGGLTIARSSDARQARLPTVLEDFAEPLPELIE